MSEFADDDQAWLDALAGREVALSPARREAQLLRAALRTGIAADALPAAADAARETRLIEHARRAGLIRRAADWRRLPRWTLPWAASVVLVLGAGILVQLQRDHATFVVRGTENGIVRIVADDPAALKQRILRELQAAGVDATGYEALGVHGIDADLPTPLTPDIRRVLAAHQIPEPPAGVLRIEIRSRE